jgi:hypothetical protein
VGLAGPESDIISFDQYYPNHPPPDSCAVLETVFRRILKAWYQQPLYRDLPLYREYEFLPKLPRVAQWVEKEFSITPEQEKIFIQEVDWKVINPVWFVRSHVPPRLDVEFPTYQAVVHGDLNTRNILLDEKANVWLIDFSEAHEGHILSDLVKLEACLKFESSDLESWDDVRAMLELEAALLAPTRLDHIPVYPDTSGRDWPSRIYPMVRTLRELANVLTVLENDPVQYYLGLLYFTLQVLRYPQISKMTRLYALLSAGRICQYLQERDSR